MTKSQEGARNRLLEAVNENNHKLLSEYIDSKTKILIDFNCGHEPQYVLSTNYISGHNKCRYCTNQLIKPFRDDVYTKRPDLLKYFKNENDAIGLAVTTKRKILCKCSICGYEKEYAMYTLFYSGFACDNCRDSKSFPEKVMGNVLDDLNIKYETEVRFDWCVYELEGKKHYGCYDFVIETLKTIIEMDGLFHYNSTDFDDVENIKQKDKIKNELAIANGYNIYRIDCGYINQSEKYDYVKNNIIKILGNIFDLSNINWNNVFLRSDKPIIHTASELWNAGYSTNYIIDKLHISNSCLIDILNQAHKIGICTYTKESSNNRASYFRTFRHNKYLKVLRNNEIIGVLWDLNVFSKNYIDKYNLPMNRININRVLRGDAKTTIGGETFEEITKDEYIQLLDMPNIITDDGLGCSDNALIQIYPKCYDLIFNKAS